MQTHDIFYASLKKLLQSQQAQSGNQSSRVSKLKSSRNKLGLLINEFNHPHPQQISLQKINKSPSPDRIQRNYFLPSLQASQVRITQEVGASTNLTTQKTPSLSKTYQDHNKSFHSSSNDSNIQSKFVRIEEFPDSKKLKVDMLKQAENTILYLLRKKNPDQAMVQMNEVVNAVIETNDINLLAQSFDLIADIAITARDFKNALNAYNKMRQIGEYSKDNDLKVTAILKISDLCKFLKKFDMAKIFLKRALQYVWLDKKTGHESNIYDKLGIIYFLEGNMEKAKSFHQRSVGFLLEEDQSPAKKHSIESLKKYQSEQMFNTQEINRMLLAKLGMIGEKAVNGSSSEFKLFSNVDFELQIEQIMEEEDVDNIIGTPQSNFNEFKLQIQNRVERKMDTFYLNFMMPLIGKQSACIETWKKINISKREMQFCLSYILKSTSKQKVQLDDSLMKRNIDDKINKRNEDKKQESSSVEKFKQESQRFASVRPIFQRNHGTYFHNHLSPNRNIDGFNYCHKPCNKKVSGLCKQLKQKLIYQ